MTSTRSKVAARARPDDIDAPIHYAVTRSQFGALLVAGSERGVVAIALADHKKTLLADLQARHPLAKSAPAGHPAVTWARALKEYLDAGAAWPELPLDLRGTQFQLRVWLALLSIKIGDRVSYAEVARRLGRPQAARAVARACATNTLALAVPCHRVQAQSGALSGYRWGVARKRALLTFEQQRSGALAGSGSGG